MEVDRLLAEGKISKESKSVSQSVSSLDRDDEDTPIIKQVFQLLKKPQYSIVNYKVIKYY